AYGGAPPYPSVADGFYLAFYPACYAGLMLLIRSRLSALPRSLWLDGGMATLASSALGAAVLFEVVVGSIHGSASVVATTLAYPPNEPVRRSKGGRCWGRRSSAG